MYQPFNPYKQSEHSDRRTQIALIHLNTILASQSGREFLKYLIYSFDVGTVPPIGLPEELTRDWMGFSRAGRSIFELISQADNVQAGLMLAEVIKEKYTNENQTPINE